MATIEIKIPSVGESVQEATLAQWFKKDGESVKKDEPVFVIETDKITLEVNAEADGVLHISVKEGETVAIGTVVGQIDTEAAADETSEAESPKAPRPDSSEAASDKSDQAPEKEKETAPRPEQGDAEKEDSAPDDATKKKEAADTDALPPSVRRLVKQHDVELGRIDGTGPNGRITKGDVLLYLESRKGTPQPKAKAAEPEAPSPETGQEKAREEGITRKPMSPIRRRIAARLLEAKQNTAMLTTFNDIDMTRAMEIRSTHKEAFSKKHDVSLGFMSFFVKATVQALKEFPEINAYIDGSDIVYHDYYHVGIAVGSPKGLVVPVIRNADRLSFAGVEQAIVDFVKKIKENRLEISDLEGATFTITNGGVFGSLLSTPILNPPQSAILGMHRIEKRPVVISDEIVIRSMMYVALSYDHRIVDGREAVTFLRRIKECVEQPERLLMEV